MKVLIVEDDPIKVRQLADLLREEVTGIEVVERRSYQSGLKSALEDCPDLIVLDMSLPTFDVSAKEDGGRPRPFGGRDILREVSRKGVRTRAIVVTGFETFGEEQTNLGELHSELQATFPEIYLGAIHYNPAQTAWKAQLLGVVRRAAGETAR